MKQGVVIKANRGKDLYYYKSQTAKDILKREDGSAIRTLWSAEPITIANKYIKIIVFPDGSVSMDGHEQVKEWERQFTDRTCCVYHIHADLDPQKRYLNTGYIGITTQLPMERFEQHAQAESVVGDEIRKQGLSFENMTVIFRGTEEECRRKEKELRPVMNVGWNVAIGG